jgi:hypothetical protein
MSKESRIAAAVLWFTLVALASLLVRNTEAVNQGNDIGKRQEYQRVLLGCNSAGALQSTDAMLRELCDVRLLELAEELN